MLRVCRNDKTGPWLRIERGVVRKCAVGLDRIHERIHFGELIQVREHVRGSRGTAPIRDPTGHFEISRRCSGRHRRKCEEYGDNKKVEEFLHRV